MTTSDQINELAAALAKAQGEMGGAAKSTTNTFFKSRYADLASVWDACRAPLAANELAIIQSPSVEGVCVTVDTLMVHTSGQWARNSLHASAKDDSPQAIGSTITYLRRYALQSVAGVAPEDDDAEAAQGRPKVVAKPTEVPKPPDDSYPAWWKTLDEAADLGLTALKTAWDAAPKDYKSYALAQSNAAWMALKQRAAQVAA